MKVRLEVGPKEAEEGGCIFSVSSKPGEVATKVAMQVGHIAQPYSLRFHADLT